jgi:hypothetical protein
MWLRKLRNRIIFSIYGKKAYTTFSTGYVYKGNYIIVTGFVNAGDMIYLEGI